MANNFKISIKHKGGTVHINLKGDFDGTSACQLFNILREKLVGVEKIVVHTDSLKNIFPFGRQVLERNFSYLDYARRVSFEGEHSRQLFSGGHLSL